MTETPEKLILAGKYEEFKGGELTVVSSPRWAGKRQDMLLGPPREAVMIVTDGEEFLTAQEACAALDIKPATLYAYVSRGLLSSYRQGIKRMRLYRREEVERLTRLRGPGDRETLKPGKDDDDDERWIPYV